MKSLERKFVIEDGKGAESYDTRCGWWPFNFSKFAATSCMYMCVYVFLVLFSEASFTYSHAVATTIEKRFKISSITTGRISVVNDVIAAFFALFGTFIASKGHRPRWMGYATVTMAMYCFISALPHFIWGAGRDALDLTEEGAVFARSSRFADDQKPLSTLCNSTFDDTVTRAEHRLESEDEGLSPLLILAAGQLMNGFGSSLLFTLGSAYMDDNCEKSQAPLFISITNTFRVFAPFLAGAVATCLGTYINPSLTPNITPMDSRWLGAWWIGWLILGFLLLFIALPVSMFPKVLPATVARKQRAIRENAAAPDGQALTEPSKDCDDDAYSTFRRLLSNKASCFNIFSLVFFVGGAVVPMMYAPKYLETQFRIAAKDAGLFQISATVPAALLGLWVSEIVTSKLKPSARSVALWGCIAAAFAVVGTCVYPQLGCLENDLQMEMINLQNDVCFECNCTQAKFSPVCLEDRNITFVSACHAGCKSVVMEGAQEVYTNCSCSDDFHTVDNSSSRAYPGMCPVDCQSEILNTAILMALITFVTSTARGGQTLIAVRCVEERDKGMALSLTLALIHIGPMIIAPILFGYLVDSACIKWDNMISMSGNCWLYDNEKMRYFFYYGAAGLLLMQLFCDIGTYCSVGDLKLFDEEDDKKEQIEMADSKGLPMERKNSEDSESTF